MSLKNFVILSVVILLLNCVGLNNSKPLLSNNINLTTSKIQKVSMFFKQEKAT